MHWTEALDGSLDAPDVVHALLVQPEAVRLILTLNQHLDVASKAAGEGGRGAGEAAATERVCARPTHYSLSFSKNTLISSSVRGRILK